MSPAGTFLVAGLGLRAWRLEQIGPQLDVAIAASEQRAGVVWLMAKQATSECALLSSSRREPENTLSLADLIEKTARILPVSAYPTERRLSEPKPGERNIDLVGLVSSAANLPALLDNSPLFAKTALTAAIMQDLQEKRERFPMQTRVRAENPASRR